MKTVSKEQLEIFTSYMEDEIDVALLLQFIEAKARVKSLEIDRLKEMMGIAPILLLQEV